MRDLIRRIQDFTGLRPRHIQDRTGLRLVLEVPVGASEVTWRHLVVLVSRLPGSTVESRPDGGAVIALRIADGAMHGTCGGCGKEDVPTWAATRTLNLCLDCLEARVAGQVARATTPGGGKPQ
jgi:hypothetical protein